MARRHLGAADRPQANANRFSIDLDFAERRSSLPDRHPAFLNAASCIAGFWSSVDTRA
jgi:hypothetical protein